MRGEAVVAAGGHDHLAVVGDNLGGGAHPLDRLVEVLVQREAAVGGDHQREAPVDRGHGRLLHVAAALLVRADHVAAEEAADLALVIERDVHQKVDRQG